MTTYNTGNPIGSKDPRDLYDNAENLDNLVNGPLMSYADRLGIARRTLLGIDAAADLVLDGIGYAPPVPYAAGIVLTLTTQTVEYNGEIYAPKSASLPFTTSGTFETAKFRLVQANDALRVFYTPSGNAPVVTTVHNKLRELDSICALVNQFGLMEAFESVRKLENSHATLPGPFYFGITGYGDSMASVDSYTLAILIRALELRYGLGGLFTPGLGRTWFNAEWTITGGASQPRTDWSYLPGANQIVMPSGSTISTTTGAMSTASNQILLSALPTEMFTGDTIKEFVLNFINVRVFYLTRPGDGTLTVTISQGIVSGYSPVVVSCNGATGLAYFDVPVLDKAMQVKIDVAASGGTCIFIGAVFLRESGVLGWTSQVGGSTMQQMNAYIDNGNLTAIYKPLCRALSTALVIHAQRAADDPDIPGNYAKHFNAIDTMPEISQFVLGEPPQISNVGDAGSVVINDILLRECLSRGYAYYDQHRALGASNAVLTTLGWGDADGVHLDPPAHRYLSGKILDAVDWFRMGGNKADIDPLTMGSLLKRLSMLQAFMALRSNEVSFRAGSTVEGGIYTGGFTFTSDNTKGCVLTSTAAVGAAACRCANMITNSPNLTTSKFDIYHALVGYRNMALQVGLRAFMLFGVTATFASLASLNQQCYGVEFAMGVDVGSPGGTVSEVARLFWTNGTTITYGTWIALVPPGWGTITGNGLNIVVGWSKASARLTLYQQQVATMMPRTSIPAPFFSTNNTAGSWLNIALVAEGTAPTLAGSFSLVCIKTNFGPNTRSILGNSLFSNIV